ncbi:class I SAM-dependent methyltransferase [Pontibacter anaerobius]|uniref:Class I SAM-dependent methyltransferase n=1 Tax=Pontibacter anaerobius TaxID=2993940 RepID=A0ABT3RAY6_9BACT|nr:class I SAM-dependent methyltransferase [Pontibacter anaerobius]MCX2739031.1 class I SAM-dependent methyltransferase [Pontibacter anaerobius]
MQEFWNKRYSEEETVYGTAPNVFFKEQLSKLQPGKLLLPAEGEGRNALYAAEQGWEVQAFDYSEAGQQKALKLAQERGVSIDYQLTEADKYNAKPDSLDAVALIYAHFPPALRQGFHRKVVGWLKPGGTVILEAFHPKQLGYNSGGPKDEAMLYTADMLRQDFSGLQINQLEELETELQEGPYHSGKGFVTRLVATKPAQ